MKTNFPTISADMAIPLSKISLPSSSSSSSSPNSLKNIIPSFPIKSLKLASTKSRPHKIIATTAIRAIQDNRTENNTASDSEPDLPNEKTISDDQLAKIGGADEAAERLGAEIKAAMKQRAEKEQDLSFDGVAREINEIEWPPFGKVVGTTGVVLGVIAGSSVVLLTVNAVLAELSDRVFAGRGVQDFFS